MGPVTYILGGYDGNEGDPQVLATTDGSHFATVAQLKVAVRYPAVALIDKGQQVSVTHRGTGQHGDDTERPGPDQRQNDAPSKHK